MVHFKKIPLKENVGKVLYDKKIVDDVILLAVSETPYVQLSGKVSFDKMKTNCINIAVTKNSVYVVVKVKIHYTQSISDIAFKIQESIRHNVEVMTEYRVSGVDVIVDGVFFD